MALDVISDPKIPRCSAEFFNRIGGKRPFAALATNDSNAQKARFAKSRVRVAVRDMPGPELPFERDSAFCRMHVITAGLTESPRQPPNCLTLIGTEGAGLTSRYHIGMSFDGLISRFLTMNKFSFVSAILLSTYVS